MADNEWVWAAADYTGSRERLDFLFYLGYNKIFTHSISIISLDSGL